MDTDWCLTCDCHFEGVGPYCSAVCENRAEPSSSANHTFFSQPSTEFFSEEEDYDDEMIFHLEDDAQSSACGSARILAWAAEIPAGPPSSDIDEPSPPSTPSTSAYRSPKLLLPHQRPMPPTLCMSTPQPARTFPSRPIVTPQQQIATLSIARSGDAGSMGKTSLLSGATESSVATPASANPVPMSSSSRRASVLDNIASHVRSWVSSSPHLPDSPSHLKERISATSSQKDVTKFTINLASSSFSSFDQKSDDKASPPYWVSSTIMFDTSTKSKVEISTSGRLALDHPSYRSRGRKLSRAVA